MRVVGHPRPRKAARAGFPRRDLDYVADIDGNCIADLRDLAIMLASWLDDYTLTDAIAQ